MKPYYERDGITIYHGDCREVLPEIDGVTLTFTSPPYNTLGSRIPSRPTGMWGRRGGGLGFAEAVRDDGYPDDMDESEYQAEQLAIMGLVSISTAPGGCLFYNHKCRWRDGVLLHPVRWANPNGWTFRQEMIWNRGGSMTLNARMFAPSEERILWFEKPGQRKWNQPEGSAMLSVWSVSPESGDQKPHPVSFPIALPMRAIAAVTDRGDVVLDPFAGSGTTLAAAAVLGRRAIGIEIEERYCEIAAKRLSQRVMFGAQS